MWDAACLGELVIDLVPHSRVDGAWLYAANPGGAPGNVAAGLARLGRSALMIGKVGDETFGRAIADALAGFGVDTSGVTPTRHGKTRLSVVTLDADGDRDFIFYRDNPADTLIDAADIDPTMIENAKLLHVGLLLMAAPRSAAAQARAIGIARAAGIPIALDPNFRPSLWPTEDAMLKAARQAIAEASIVKLSEEELRALAGGGSLEEAARSLWHDGLKIVAITRGAQGAELFTPGATLSCRGYSVAAIDTTAAGDAFMASLISGLLDAGGETRLPDILRSACAGGALAATRKGAMGSLPDRAEIARFLASTAENSP